VNSPIIPTVDAAMLKAISVATDIHATEQSFAGVFGTIRDVFRQEITPLKAALPAEHKSRQIAFAELRASIGEAFDQLDHDRETNCCLEQCKDSAWELIVPWLERLER